MSLPPYVTDYGPIVENAVAALARNTADTRREAYARVKSIVMHHLRLSGQPDAIVELETLALDLAVSKVERRWRSAQAAELPVRKPVPKREARGIPSLEAPAPPSPVGRESEGRAVGFGSLAAILRPRAMRMGLAIGVPAIAIAVLIAVLAGDNSWYRSPADRPKSQDRLLAGPEPSVSAPNSSQAAGAATSVGPTKVRPVRADFGAVP
jgi:hypothetical protein